MAAHAKLGASNAHRWLYCPGSVQAEDGIADKGSPHATEGSAAHALAEHCLNNGGSPFDWEGHPAPEYNEITVDRQMATAIREYMDYVAEIGGMQEYERRVHYGDWVPGGFGTADVIAYDEATNTVHVVDLKYGQGVLVNAERNTQGMLYGLGALNEYGPFAEIEHVHIHIVQPRKDHIDDWCVSVPALLEWAEWVAERATEAASGTGERVPGESQCRFCKAAATCPALRDYTHKIVGQDFDNLDSDSLTDEQLREVLDAKPLIVKFLEAVEAHAKEKLENGQSFPGYKLVAGRSVRQWGDEVEAEIELRAKLGDEAYERKLLSPAKAEKALGKKKAADLQELIVKPEGKPTLAPASDKRAPVNVSADDFDA